MAWPTSSLGTPTPSPSRSTGCWATRQLTKVRSVSPVQRRRTGSLSHWNTAWPLQVGPETVTRPASMISPCSCPPRLAGRLRTTCSLCDADEGPGAGGAGAASRRAMQGSKCREAEEQNSHCKRQRNRFSIYTALVACARISQKFLSKNTCCCCPPSLAAARVTL